MEKERGKCRIELSLLSLLIVSKSRKNSLNPVINFVFNCQKFNIEMKNGVNLLIVLYSTVF